MKKMLGAVLLLVFLVGAYFFIKKWKGTVSWGVGTGKIAHHNTDAGAVKNSLIRDISENPGKYNGKQVSLTGRVRGPGKYASNRNLYKLTDGKYSLLVVDDKSAPIEYANRSVSGVVKEVKPPIGSGYAYIVSVKGNPNIDLKWTDVAKFFTTKYDAVKKGVHDATS